MHKLILILFIFPLAVIAQEPITYHSADSISYQYYLAGDWDKLINFGNEAIRQDVDFKNLRKRVGYAHFVKADFFSAQNQYLKALKFDTGDEDVKQYLYYCGINLGDKGSSKYYASKLSVDNQKYMGLKSNKFFDVIDVEYNHKINSVSSRSNPTYLRAGLSSQLTYRLSLYQSFSNFNQSELNAITDPTPNIIVSESARKTQNEYYASLNWQISSKTSLLVGYHYLNAKVLDTVTVVDNSLPTTHPNYKTITPGTTFYPGNMFIAKASTKFNRFDFSLYGSTFTMDSLTTNQIGVQLGYLIPGKKSIYLKTSIYQLLETNNNHLVFSQSAGLVLLKNLWLEGSVTLGNLKNYADGNGLYMFNSTDETTFRTAATLMWSPGKKLSFFGNYGYDKKLNISNNTTYNQNSITGGIIWKL